MHIRAFAAPDKIHWATRAVKRIDGSRVGPFNQKNFRVRVLVFLIRLNSVFFGSDRASPWPDRASPQLSG